MKSAADLRSILDRYTAAPMFSASLLFLVFLAGGLQETAGGITLPLGTSLYWRGLLWLYPLFPLELAVVLLLGYPPRTRLVLAALIPPLRLIGRDHRTGEQVWIPCWGWVKADRDLVKRMEKIFSGPMIVISLMVLPLLAVENIWTEEIARNKQLKFLLDTDTTVIWLAFTTEFIVMISLTDKKIRYCAKHWLDLVIICLPMVTFLPALRLVGAARLTQVPKFSRVFRLRGTLMRMFRAMTALDVVRRLTGFDPEKRLDQLREQAAEKELELEDIRREIADLEQQIAAAEPNSTEQNNVEQNKVR